MTHKKTLILIVNDTIDFFKKGFLESVLDDLGCPVNGNNPPFLNMAVNIPAQEIKKHYSIPSQIPYSQRAYLKNNIKNKISYSRKHY